MGQCPQCGCAEHTRLCAIVGWRLERPLWPWGRERVRTVELGARYSCQRCGTNYSVTSRGAWIQHPHSLPFTPQPQPAEDLSEAPTGSNGLERVMAAEAGDKIDKFAQSMRRNQPPVPRERPRP